MYLYHPMTFAKKKHGEVEIKTKTAECFEVVNNRYAFLLDVPRMSVRYQEPTSFHLLYHKGRLLTSDQPIEIYQQYLSFNRAHGDVLVGGLGLGMAACLIHDLGGVRSVTVVEKEKEIIELIQPQIHPDIEVIHADLYDFLKSPPRIYDFAYHDIWYGCGESTWVYDLVPLLRLSRKAGIADIGAWGDFEMHAQLRPALYGRAFMPRIASNWTPYRIFMDAAVEKLGQEPPFPESATRKIESLVEFYLNKVGTPRWEKTFNWPEKIEEEAA